jgi:hypothetical protein
MMNEIANVIDGNKAYVIETDGGKYVIHLYQGYDLVETKEYNEHTFRIVENYGKDWLKR